MLTNRFGKIAGHYWHEVLSEAYSHLQVDIKNDPVAMEKLKSEILSFFSQRAKFLFGDEVSVEIEFEEGSLITKLRIKGIAASVIAAGMLQYGSFRESVDYLAQDATLLAQSANLEMIFRTKAAHCDRVRIEKRKGVFGRLDSLLSELDTVKREIKDSTMPRTSRAADGFTRATTERLLEWEKSANRLFNQFDHDDTRACVAAGLLEELEKLPEAVPWKDELTDSSLRSMMANADPEGAGIIEGAATRYSATIKSLKKLYKDAVSQYSPKSV